MSITLRQYQDVDFLKVSKFLISNFLPFNQDGNWLEPTWDYMHCHPLLDENSLEKIGLWEESGRMVGAAHYECSLGEAFFELHPDYAHLKAEMIAYAEENVLGEAKNGIRFLHAYINDFDADFEQIITSRGYQLDPNNHRSLSYLKIPNQFPDLDLPEGYLLKSLADDNNLSKINRVLWRGFNHPGEAPLEEIREREKMQSSPNFRKDLTIVIEEPGGNFVSFCGM